MRLADIKPGEVLSTAGVLVFASGGDVHIVQTAMGVKYKTYLSPFSAVVMAAHLVWAAVSAKCWMRK